MWIQTIGSHICLITGIYHCLTCIILDTRYFTLELRPLTKERFYLPSVYSLDVLRMLKPYYRSNMWTTSYSSCSNRTLAIPTSDGLAIMFYPYIIQFCRYVSWLYPSMNKVWCWFPTIDIRITSTYMYSSMYEAAWRTW